MTWQLLLFGSPRLEQNGKVVSLKRRKRLALLIYLVVTGQAHSREALATLLWPEYDASQGKANLRRELSVLLRTVGKEALLVSRAEIGINPAFELDCDVVTFKQFLVGEGMNTTAVSPTHITQLQQAVELYQAEFLAGFNLPDCPEFDEWQFFQREEMRRLATGAAQTLVAWSLEQKTYEAGVGYGRFWLTLDPWHEPAHRELMKLYALSDQMAAAMRQYDECVRLLDEELGVEPEAETVALFEAIRAREFGVDEQGDRRAEEQGSRGVGEDWEGGGGVPLSNVPVPVTTFVGRGDEVTEVVNLLADSEQRLVTVVGPGGMGKTRLALAVATAVVDAFAHGVHFVPLAPLTAVDHIATTLADVFHLRTTGDAAHEQLFNYLRDKQLLLVMDNYEHLIDGAYLVTELLQTAPQVKVLATSRERLNLMGEWVFTLSGLPVKNGTATSSAMQLLQNHAELAHPGLVIQTEDIAHIEKICNMVGGMPLALILAASWADMFSFAEIAAEIQQNVDFLETDMMDIPVRQRSIRAVFETSWRRLTADQQQVFMKLSVFHGGFTRQAAQKVAGANLRNLRALINQSLVVTEEDGRYAIHELLRQYAAAKLAASGELEATELAHSNYYLAALRAWEDDLRAGPRQITALREVERAWENVRAAWYLAVEMGNVTAVNQAVEGLHFFVEMSGRYPEGIAFLNAAREQFFPLDQPTNNPIWGRLTIRDTFMRLVSRGGESLAPMIDTCLQVAKSTDNGLEIGLCLWVKGTYFFMFRDDPQLGLRLLQQSLVYFEKLQDGFYLTRVQGMIGYCHSRITGMDEYSEWLERSVATAQAMGNVMGQAYVLCNMMDIAFGRGNYEMVEQYCQEVMAASRRFYDPITNSYAYILLGLYCFLVGRWNEVEQWVVPGAKEADLYRFANNQCYAQAVLSLLATISGRYEQAVLYGENSLDNPLHDRFGAIVSHWALALAHTAAGETDMAWHYVRHMVALTRQYGSTAVLTWVLPITAVLYSQQNQFERAVQHLALAVHHPLSPQGWLTKWSLLTKIQKQLQQQLGTKVYQATWQQGQIVELDELLAYIDMPA